MKPEADDREHDGTLKLSRRSFLKGMGSGALQHNRYKIAAAQGILQEEALGQLV